MTQVLDLTDLIGKKDKLVKYYDNLMAQLHISNDYKFEPKHKIIGDLK